jgi:GTP-binding protein EngB required for normal cell division
VTPRILSWQLQQQYDSLRSLLQRALWLAESCADHEASTILRARLTNLHAAALLVIVGEVKAGKSSFINALVREDVCQVAPGPCTARIQELVYGPERSVANLGPSWDRVYLPKEVLREITIVDTPGTNSIVQDHQTITENYIPQSDLVVFVFSAVNPHTKTAWEFLSKVKKDWHRKMVFVLQQADRASAEEQMTNRAHVEQYARDRQVEHPTVFPLSAKLELEGDPYSGFPEFREYLRSAIQTGDVWRMKVEGASHTIRGVMVKLLAQLRREKELIAEERAFYHELLGKVQAREAKAESLRQLVVGRLAATYDNLAHDAQGEFAEGLKMGSLLRHAAPFTGKKRLRAWLSEVRKRFQLAVRSEVASQAPKLSVALLDELQGMRRELNERIAKREERIRENVVLPDAAARLASLQNLRANLENVPVAADVNFSSDIEEVAEVRRFAVAGSVLAIMGIVLVALSGVAWADVAGIVFAGVGIFLFASGLIWRRASLLRDFEEKLDSSRDRFHARLETETSAICDDLFFDVRHSLTESIFRLDVRSSQVDAPLSETFRIGEAADEMVLRSQNGAAQIAA